MTIKEVCRQYGISADTLRYYEKIGVIPDVNRTKGGQRDYLESDLAWVKMAICLRGTGLPVEELAEYVRLYRQGCSTIGQRLALLKKQREQVQHQKEELETALSRLNQKIAYYEQAQARGSICCDPSECSCDCPVQACGENASAPTEDRT